MKNIFKGIASSLDSIGDKFRKMETQKVGHNIAKGIASGAIDKSAYTAEQLSAYANKLGGAVGGGVEGLAIGASGGAIIGGIAGGVDEDDTVLGGAVKGALIGGGIGGIGGNISGRIHRNPHLIENTIKDLGTAKKMLSGLGKDGIDLNPGDKVIF